MNIYLTLSLSFPIVYISNILPPPFSISPSPSHYCISPTPITLPPLPPPTIHSLYPHSNRLPECLCQSFCLAHLEGEYLAASDGSERCVRSECLSHPHGDGSLTGTWLTRNQYSSAGYFTFLMGEREGEREREREREREVKAVQPPVDAAPSP